MTHTSALLSSLASQSLFDYVRGEDLDTVIFDLPDAVKQIFESSPLDCVMRIRGELPN